MNLEPKDLRQMLDTAIAAARSAGQLAMEKIHHVKATIKNEVELVTEADRRCQQIIVDCLHKAFPNHGFIAEEGEGGRLFKQSPRGQPAIWWVIDPIDGTHNYAHGIALFAISIAAMFEGRPVVGVIFEPARNSMYSAVEAGEAQLNGRPITATDQGVSLLTSVGLDSHFDRFLPAGMCEIMKRTRFRNFGSTALQMAYVASGGLVGTVMCTAKLWDFAAGAVIVPAAGGILSDWQGGELFPMDLDRYEGQPVPSLAANKTALPQLIELMRA